MTSYRNSPSSPVLCPGPFISHSNFYLVNFEGFDFMFLSFLTFLILGLVSLVLDTLLKFSTLYPHLSYGALLSVLSRFFITFIITDSQKVLISVCCMVSRSFESLLVLSILSFLGVDL